MIASLAEHLTQLAVFAALKEDPVFQAFIAMCKAAGTDQERNAVCTFAGRLYGRQTENWTQYLMNTVLCLDTCLVHCSNCGRELPSRMLNAAMYELKILSQAAEVSPEMLNHQTPWDWIAYPVDLQAEYLNRLMEIERYGAGVFAQASMFRLKNADSPELIPVANADPISFDQLYGYDQQHQQIIENTRALLYGLPAVNLLLYGDAGTGKSASIKAVVNQFKSDGLRLVEAGKDQLDLLPELLDELAEQPVKFIVYIDDLSFSEQDDSFASLKAILEGSVSARAANTVIYATSNRRHLVKESVSARTGDDMHRRDTLQETLSLSQRFGQCLFFERPNKDDYLKLVGQISHEFGMRCDEAMEKEAESFALRQGGRSARTARQFVSSYFARKGMHDA